MKRVDGLALERELRGAVAHPQMIDEIVRHHDRERGMIALKPGHELLIARRESVAGEIADYGQRSTVRQQGVERGAELVFRARRNSRCARHSLHTEPGARPHFARRITRLNEERHADPGLPFHEYEYRFGLGESGEIIE